MSSEGEKPRYCMDWCMQCVRNRENFKVNWDSGPSLWAIYHPLNNVIISWLVCRSPHPMHACRFPSLFNVSMNMQHWKAGNRAEEGGNLFNLQYTACMQGYPYLLFAIIYLALDVVVHTWEKCNFENLSPPLGLSCNAACY
jgi:hypothetical protein